MGQTVFVVVNEWANGYRGENAVVGVFSTHQAAQDAANLKGLGVAMKLRVEEMDVLESCPCRDITVYTAHATSGCDEAFWRRTEIVTVNNGDDFPDGIYHKAKSRYFLKWRISKHGRKVDSYGNRLDESGTDTVVEVRSVISQKHACEAALAEVSKEREAVAA